MIDGSALFLTMFNNLAIFIVFVTLYGYVKRLEIQRAWIKPILVGLLFGITTLLCMRVRIHVAEGVIVDQRNAIIVLSTLFGGLPAGIVTLVMAASYRAYLGGIGVLSGITGMFLSLSAGWILRRWRSENRNIAFYLLGSLLATLIILPGFLLVGDLANGWALLKRMFVPFGSAIYLGIVFVGLLLQREENRIRTAEKLTESEKKFRNLYESIIDVSYQTDSAGIFTEISPSVEKSTGYTPEEMIGTPVSDYYTNPQDRDVFLKEIMEKGYVENFRAKMQKKDGGTIWVSTNAVPLFNQKKEITGIRGMVRDITRLKNAQDEKQRLEKSLQQSQKLEALGTLAGGIAHDFNNILGAILGYTELALDSAEDNGEEKEYLKAVLNATERARNLISQILMFSRNIKTEKKAFAPEPLIREALQLLRQTIPSSVNIEMELDRNTGSIMADANQIHQVILNLGTNAFHALYEESGSIWIKLYPLSLERENPRKYPELPAGNYACLEVIDNGRGIGKDNLERIFEPFFSTKEKGKGTGLGLAVVHGIIQDHGGKIFVDSSPGKGTSIRILLPVTDEKLEIESRDKLVEDLHLRGHERILVVDDEKPLADLVNRMLQSMGYTVYSTVSSQQALEEFRKNPESFDLLLTDQTMPGMTGWNLAAEVLKIRPGMPVIIATGYSSVLNEKEAEQIGVSRIIVKPLSKLSLAKVVRQVLDQ